jgi:hypothetical protein
VGSFPAALSFSSLSKEALAAATSIKLPPKGFFSYFFISYLSSRAILSS